MINPSIQREIQNYTISFRNSAIVTLGALVALVALCVLLKDPLKSDFGTASLALLIPLTILGAGRTADFLRKIYSASRNIMPPLLPLERDEGLSESRSQSEDGKYDHSDESREISQVSEISSQLPIPRDADLGLEEIDSSEERVVAPEQEPQAPKDTPLQYSSSAVLSHPKPLPASAVEERPPLLPITREEMLANINRTGQTCYEHLVDIRNHLALLLKSLHSSPEPLRKIEHMLQERLLNTVGTDKNEIKKKIKEVQNRIKESEKAHRQIDELIALLMRAEKACLQLFRDAQAKKQSIEIVHNLYMIVINLSIQNEEEKIQNAIKEIHEIDKKIAYASKPSFFGGKKADPQTEIEKLENEKKRLEKSKDRTAKFSAKLTGFLNRLMKSYHQQPEGPPYLQEMFSGEVFAQQELDLLQLNTFEEVRKFDKINNPQFVHYFADGKEGEEINNSPPDNVFIGMLDNIMSDVKKCKENQKKINIAAACASPFVTRWIKKIAYEQLEKLLPAFEGVSKKQKEAFRAEMQTIIKRMAEIAISLGRKSLSSTSMEEIEERIKTTLTGADAAYLSLFHLFHRETKSGYEVAKAPTMQGVFDNVKNHLKPLCAELDQIYQ